MEVDKPCVYEIRVEGHLTYRWSEWFEGPAIRNEPNGETTLGGLPLECDASVLHTAHRKRGP
jgi:hypothetical protein